MKKILGIIGIVIFGLFPTLALVGATDDIVDDHIHGAVTPREIAPLFFSKLSERYLRQLATWNDTSIERFVSREIPLSDRNYRPENLLAISGAYIEEAGRTSYLRKDALQALRLLAKDFFQEFRTPLVVISGYRSVEYQKRLWDLGRCTPELCAPPGYSEHQLGLAIDIFDASTAEAYMSNARIKKYILWMQKNAHTYGYTQSYQKGARIDGYGVEPWHWRYVGVDLATRLYTMKMTYSEYVEWESMWKILNL